MPEGSAITAVLGPTNTGKTHRAVERMLTHETGMIGLPLRLLAREVYDRLTTRVGESRVALVTGEEKRVPRRPDYWVCTVEAMPTDLEVDFIAIDEIQLAAHERRGHVFTERLLGARGRRETWFMGAATMRPVIAEIVPTAVHEVFPRLSRLSATGTSKLSRLPPRSAVIGFSMPQVYAIAERLRALRGGAAVVLGALSPRTRNAQVALFQSGEVGYLVATDAIGMGLNLDVSHVAFASLRKFDGRVDRELSAAELAQIAGRAGRYLADGSFGAIDPLVLPGDLVTAIEGHRFPPVRRLFWRNTDLDFTSIDALLASLRRPARRGCLRLGDVAEDMAALEMLAADPALRARARDPETVALLWDVCRIPDFRKLLLESHVALLAEVFEMLTGPRAVLDQDFLAERLAEIDDVASDIDTLIGRLSAIRTWTYISHQSRWLERAAEWQERARDIEDRLSDSLHERLVQRFVEHGATKRAAPPLRPRGRLMAKEDPKEVHPSHPFAQLAALRASLAPAAVAPGRDSDAWVEEIIAAPHGRFSVDAKGAVAHDGRPIGKLTRGTSLLLPEVRLNGVDDLGPGARSRVLRRLVAFARDWVGALLAPLRAPELRAISPAARGIAYQIEQGLGTALAREAKGQLEELDPDQRGRLSTLGVEVGERVLYVPALLRHPAIEQRLALWAVYFDGTAPPVAPRPGAVSMAVTAGSDPRAYVAIGYPVFGARAIRADVAERVHRALTGADGDQAERHVASWVGCRAREVPAIAQALSSE